MTAIQASDWRSPGQPLIEVFSFELTNHRNCLCSFGFSWYRCRRLPKQFQEPIHASGPSLVPLSYDFTPQLLTITMPLVPLLGNITGIGIKPTSSFAALLGLLIGDAAGQPIAYRLFHPSQGGVLFL